MHSFSNGHANYRSIVCKTLKRMQLSFICGATQCVDVSCSRFQTRQTKNNNFSVRASNFCKALNNLERYRIQRSTDSSRNRLPVHLKRERVVSFGKANVHLEIFISSPKDNPLSRQSDVYFETF